MSESSNHKREPSSHRIVPAPSTYVGSIEVDCSSWDAEPGDVPQASQPLKSAAIHAGSFDLEFIEAKSIEIVMNVENCKSKGDASQQANDLINFIARADPDLELLYDSSKSQACEGHLMVVLTPQVYLKDDERLLRLIELINSNQNVPTNDTSVILRGIRLVEARSVVELYKTLNESLLSRFGTYLTREGFRRLVFQRAGVVVQ